MTEQEFDVLDELYFVISFTDLKEQTGLEEVTLKATLGQMVEKGWVKCLENVDDEVPEQALNFEQNYRRYFYLATKKGLFAHNSEN